MSRNMTPEEDAEWSPNGGGGIPQNADGYALQFIDHKDSLGRYPVAQYLSDVEPQEVEWLWPGRIAIGKLTLLIGDPGLGKSFLLLDCTARVTTGGRWPDCQEHAPQGGVILMSAEDDLPDTIRPRLDHAGADVSKVLALEAVKGSDNEGEYERSIDLQRDLEVIEAAIDDMHDQRDTVCRMVGIDPISAYMGRVDSHKNADVRSVLGPLSEFAARRRVAVVGVTHLRKGEGQAIYRAMGSLAFVAAARAAWAITKDKRDPEGKRRLFLPVKNNIAADTSGLAFHLSARNTGGVPCVEWSAEAVTVSADEALATDNRRHGPKPEREGEAEQWLTDTLANGPRLSKELFEEAHEGDGISKRTLERAKAAIGVVAYRETNPGPWWWKLGGGHIAKHNDNQPGLELLGGLGDVPESSDESDVFERQAATSPSSESHDSDDLNRLFAEAAEE